MAAIVCLILWLLYLANKDYVEAIDWYINIKYYNSLSKEGFCVVLGKMFLFLAIFSGLLAVGYFVQYTKAPEVLCLACGLTYRDVDGDGVCPHCGKNRNDFKQTDSAQVPKWLCSCGLVHPGYVSTCSCGKKKREGTMLNQQTAQKREEQTKSPVRVDKWQCSCGRVHPKYVSGCVCGQSRIRNEKTPENDGEDAVVANK